VQGRIQSVNVSGERTNQQSYSFLSIPLPLQMAVKPFAFETLSERFKDVRSRVEQAAQRCNRSPDEITLVAISKTHPTETLRAALKLGIKDFGENRVQEAESRIVDVGRQTARWHMVGHLQTNKARRAVSLFDVIHSLDSASLAKRLDRLCVQARREELPVLIQIDLAGEQSKTGIDARELPGLLEALKDCQRLRLIGLMTLPPYFEDAECARPFFKALRELRDELKLQGHFGQLRGELSMGMSHDFEIAIEEGATMLRVGTAIFGERS
jgi:pyridoxal phosphate enzyme (YggS family)